MEDDWQTIEMVVLMARGALARRDGAEAAPTDYLVRMFGVQKAVAERYETDLSPKMRAVLEAMPPGSIFMPRIIPIGSIPLLCRFRRRMWWRALCFALPFSMGWNVF
ncbi:hypothetical protein JCM17843_06440 [Kordiimonadales bacterium JCM 17843]|nr:hypothetical protein JCM17843_06440 [Kordiimonadales bacterium JCM 17843]